MKVEEREKARALRLRGWSVRAIAQKIKCSKSSISGWVRDIILTPGQIEQLKSVQDKARARAANHPNSSRAKWERFRQNIINDARREIPDRCSLENLGLIGTALYWAEGYTATRNLFVFANSDPAMIKLMISFLRKICRVPQDRLRGRVNIHPHLDIKKAQKYWARISEIPLKHFHKPLLAVSKASKYKRNTLPLGTFRVIVCDVALCSKIKGWIEGMKDWAISSVG